MSILLLISVFVKQETWRGWTNAFHVAFSTATVLILIRCAYRVAELSHGFNSKLANDQTTFMLFEACIMALATTLMSAFHPGIFLKHDGWANSGWGDRRKPAPMLQKTLDSETSSVNNGEFHEVPFNRPWPMGSQY